MDFPSLNHHHNHHHHHNRYVPPPPPPQRNFSDDRPNHYSHRHHLHPPLGLPPPPPLPYPSLPPPPPPPPLPVPPPPPSYNPHQSNFTFLDAPNPSFLNHRRSSPPQPRFSDQPHRFDYRTDSWSDPHRVQPELPHRNPILPDDHHRRVYSPGSQSESYYNPNGSERAAPSSRYRDDTIIDGYARRDISNILSQEQHVFRGSPNGRIIDRYASPRSVTDIKKPTGSGSRNMDEFVDKYEPRYMTTSEEERIWDHHGDEDPRRDHSMKGKRNEFGHGGNSGVSYGSSKEQYQYDYEPSKFNRVREGREEFKQVQKKSVLLRIGKPNNAHRNRNHEQHFSKSHMVESNNSNSRGKDKDKDHIGKDSSLYLDQKTEGNREHSPVELDVSFKSNALVAKAVVTPSSPVDNNHTQPRNKKIKRANEFGSPLSKFNERLTRSGNSSNGSECPSSTENDPKQLINKDSVMNGSLSGPPVLGQSGLSNGPLSFRLRKKRKVMKLASLASSFQLAEKDGKSVKDENVKKIPSAPIRSVISFPPLEELIAIKADEKSPQAIMVSEKDDLQVEDHDINPTENKTQTPELSENEVLVNLENGSNQTVASVADTDMFASSWQDEIETQKESCTNFNDASNVSVEMQDINATMNSLGPCLDEIITISPESDDVSRKEEGTTNTEEAPQEPLNDEDNTIDESYLPVIKRKMKISEVVFNLTTTGENEISSDKDEVTEMETLKADDEEPSRDETDLISKHDLSLESNDKLGESTDEVLIAKSSEQTVSNTSSPKNDVDICEKSVPENGQLEPGIKTSRMVEVTVNTKASLPASQGNSAPVLNTKAQGTKKPQGPNLPTTKPISASRVFVRINNPTNNIAKPRTWHRSTTNPAAVPPLPNKQVGVGPSSYIRSGNTLVRKGAPVARPSIYQMNPSGPIGPIVRPKTPPLLSSTKLAEHVPVQANSEEPLDVTSSNSQKTLSVEGGKKIQYVKRKSNQLVAADQSVQELDNRTQTSSSSDGYYKRRKNQLIRTSDSDAQKASKINIKRHSGKGVFKKYKHLRFPSVWTLGSQSSGRDGVSLRHLFPWKRSRYTAASIHTSNSNNSSSISGKLLLSRKRETIYTRSKHGFSLRMSKLLSVGASSLKWSKSIERNSKRANEEATLAVAAAEKKKREQNDTAENKTRDRIFRIGLVRYKMDPSRRTLQRISDEEPSTSKQSKEEMRKPYVPKRLLIGHNEYVRIGNGNQLVRNPKRRTRIFANEKVRWSLHTARSRLAKKKKYCQFFTRFGKCNKDDGKCPYIHDSSKIAVCTKFLNGSCSNPNCNLTHKVIPERMQDCSYFSQGLCSNVHCPYRHVNVNSAASICEGFLKGYCADGNECRKKHTYACPEYEATGACPQGTKCKLHHPKNRNTKGLRRKQQQKSARGRYFGSNSGGGEWVTVPENHHLKDDDSLCQQGMFAEYISLSGFSNEDVGDVTTSDQTARVISEPSGLGGVDVDELMKPIRIMK